VIGMAHIDPNQPVRYIPAADYIARHRPPERPPAPDWRLLVAGVACLILAAIFAVLTM
jgi:hypothetical protein